MCISLSTAIYLAFIFVIFVVGIAIVEYKLYMNEHVAVGGSVEFKAGEFGQKPLYTYVKRKDLKK